MYAKFVFYLSSILIAFILASGLRAQGLNKQQVEKILRDLQEAGMVAPEEAVKAKKELDSMTEEQWRAINNLAKQKFLGGHEVTPEKTSVEATKLDESDKVQVFAPNNKQAFKKIEGQVDEIMLENPEENKAPSRSIAGELEENSGAVDKLDPSVLEVLKRQ